MRTTRMLAAAAILGASMNMAPVANTLAVKKREDAPITFLNSIFPKGLRVGSSGDARYIKRPFHTTAQMKRRARKARNIRRHKLAMKRSGSR